MYSILFILGRIKYWFSIFMIQKWILVWDFTMQYSRIAVFCQMKVRKTAVGGGRQSDRYVSKGGFWVAGGGGGF